MATCSVKQKYSSNGNLLETKSTKHMTSNNIIAWNKDLIIFDKKKKQRFNKLQTSKQGCIVHKNCNMMKFTKDLTIIYIKKKNLTVLIMDGHIYSRYPKL